MAFGNKSKTLLLNLQKKIKPLQEKLKKITQKKKKQNNWYADRNQVFTTQKNFLVLITFLSLIATIISIVGIVKVTTSKKIEPFVIEVEERSGITNVIRPLLKEQFSYNETLRRYFLTKYIRAREEYHETTFEHNYFTVVKLMSTSEVYEKFRQTIDPSNPQSPIRMGNKSSRNIKITSITPLDNSNFKVQIRFTAIDTGARNNIQRKIATISFNYQDFDYTPAQREVNPLGFQVTSYVLTNETI